ncbi:uncharacterized protein A4U43_C03F27900 [Asparagus officinalis]|uniref:Uncharacterized protein n=1 Tax=Asparagus officinalis TaxID=4686 RepID=A0A5P1FHS0_ASPOF|nr:uncharacterized protein A4U43_C03F27900 [Asparagus officinalis]
MVSLLRALQIERVRRCHRCERHNCRWCSYITAVDAVDGEVLGSVTVVGTVVVNGPTMLLPYALQMESLDVRVMEESSQVIELWWSTDVNLVEQCGVGLNGRATVGDLVEQCDATMQTG